MSMKPRPPNISINSNRPRRHPYLTLPPLPMPQRAVPNPPPPSSAAMSDQQHRFDLSDFDRIIRIGSGSRGTVYKVLHRPTATQFALKVIYGNHDYEVRYILRQIKTLQSLDNLNIVKCHDVFDRDDEIQFILEYVDGGSLHGTHLPDESSLADLTRQILSGLYYLHRRNIAHRNIKPSHLLLNSMKQVKISAFGVSRILEQTTHPCNFSVGTIAYMSPERINTDLNHGRDDDGYAGDIWSMGVRILEFYIGILPFKIERHDDWASLMQAICMSQPPEAPATASPEFQDFVACCLQRDPGRRWTASQLLRHPFVTRQTIIDSSRRNLVASFEFLPPPPPLRPHPKPAPM